MGKLVSISSDLDVRAAAEAFRAAIENGNVAVCPCCGRNGQVIRRTVHSSMAASLVWLVGVFRRTGDWVYIPDEAPRWLINTREWGRMRYWGLVEPRPNIDNRKRTSGVWRPTQLGMDFSDGFVRIPKYVYIFDDTIIERSGDMIHVKDALGKKFSYEELVNG